MMQAMQAMYGAADRTVRCGGIRPGVPPVESGERPDEGGNRGNGAPGSKAVKGRLAKSRLLVLGACCMAAQGAHAYLDPGSGSMLLQILLGGLAGAGVLAKLYWYRIRALFGAAADEDGEQEDPALDRREE